MSQKSLWNRDLCKLFSENRSFEEVTTCIGILVKRDRATQTFQSHANRHFSLNLHIKCWVFTRLSNAAITSTFGSYTVIFHDILSKVFLVIIRYLKIV